MRLTVPRVHHEAPPLPPNERGSRPVGNVRLATLPAHRRRVSASNATTPSPQSMTVTCEAVGSKSTWLDATEISPPWASTINFAM